MLTSLTAQMETNLSFSKLNALSSYCWVCNNSTAPTEALWVWIHMEVWLKCWCQHANMQNMRMYSADMLCAIHFTLDYKPKVLRKWKVWRDGIISSSTLYLPPNPPTFKAYIWCATHCLLIKLALKGEFTEKFKLPHCLLTSMPMEAWVKCLSPQNTSGVSGVNLQPNPIKLKKLVT